MSKTIAIALVFGCVGTTAEVWFTAVMGAWARRHRKGPRDLALAGTSYVWMFAIYGGGALLFPWIYPIVAVWPVLGRVLVYAGVIFAIEFAAGAILARLTGRCPWHYDTRWAVRGYIRLDYVGVWMAFGYLVERLYLVLDGVLASTAGQPLG